ncbi:MAG TPA: hypothetical protein VIJ95_03740 [Hanamia sp.]
MKKITIILLLVFGAFSISNAQTTTSSKAKTSVSKQDKAAIAAQKKADKEAKAQAKKNADKATADQKKADKESKALAKKQAKEANTTTANTAAATHLNKKGTPDKRFKANNQPKTTAQAQIPAQTQATAAHTKVTRSATPVAHASTAKTSDKAISTDAKGRTIYQGPRGGKYYLTKNGNKEYVK